METGFCLGSNQGNRLQLLRQAKTFLLLLGRAQFIDQSPVYETEPVNVKSEYRNIKFLNAVLIVESPLTAAEWLPLIRKVEEALGRTRSADRNAPRPIDADLLFCGDEVLDSDLMQVPHPRWAERRFVVQPLADVRPELVLPGAKLPIRKILAQMPDKGDVRPYAEKW